MLVASAQREPRGPQWWRVFAIVLRLASAGGFGLVAVFLFGNVWPILSWLGIGPPVAVIALPIVYRSRRL